MAKKKTAKQKTPVKKRAPLKKQSPAKKRPPARKRSPAKKPVRRGRRVIRGVLLLIGIGIGILVPWLLYLDVAVTSAFDGRKWDLPSRVYARALNLYSGQPMRVDYLVEELRAAGFTESSSVDQPGEYSRRGNRFVIYNREFPFEDGKQPAFRFTVRLDGTAVTELAGAEGNSISLVRLNPAEIASIYPLHNEDRSIVTLGEVPQLLVSGLQAMEDRQFKHHHGVELKSIARALWANLREGEVTQGGSTITQQLVKNFYLNSDRTIIRKINEAFMAVLLELHYDKAEILEAYLNEIHLGQQGARGIHGFGRASEFYFGKSLESLDIHQVALLVGMVRGASWYNPRRNPERALQRRDLVLEVFHETGLVSQAILAAEKSKPLDVLENPGTRRSRYPGFIDLVKRQLRVIYRESDLQTAGLKIFTTLEPATQVAAEAALSDGLRDLASRGLPEELQAAFVVANINSGEVQALVGDRDPSRAGFNRALDARRQIGSVIKPLVYLQALQHETDFNLLTNIPDEPVNLRLASGEYWQPKNFDGQSHGRVPLLDALIFSYNQATVHLGMQLGVGGIIQSLRDAGVERTFEPLPSVLLGALELSPLEVSQVYQSLAAGGFRAPLRAVTSVLDSAGQPLNRYPLRLNPIKRRDVVSVLNYALTQVVERGTARSLSGLLPRGLGVAGKTGTTNERRDSWFVGYTQERLGVVWVGLDNNRPAGVTGSNGAMRIWARLFSEVPARSFQVQAAEGADWYWVNAETGELSAENCPGVQRMMFLDNGLPTRVSACLQEEAKDKPWWRKIIE